MNRRYIYMYIYVYRLCSLKERQLVQLEDSAGRLDRNFTVFNELR